MGEAFSGNPDIKRNRTGYLLDELADAGGKR